MNYLTKPHLHLAFLLSATSITHADVFTWDDGAGSNNWIASGNWNQNPGSGDYPSQKQNTDEVALLGSFSNNSGKFDIDLTTSSSASSFTIDDLDVSTDSSSDNWVLNTGAQSYAKIVIKNSMGFLLQNSGSFISNVDIELGDNQLLVGAQGGSPAILNGKIIGPSSSRFNADATVQVNGGNLANGTIRLAASNNDGFTGIVEVGRTKIEITSPNGLRNATVEMSNNNFSDRFIFPNNTLLGSLTGTANQILNNNLSVGNNNISTSYTGNFSGTGNLTKVGSGTLTLGGTNSHTGSTTINAGKIILSNGLALQNSPLVINVNNGLDIATNNVDTLAASLSGSGNLALDDQALILRSNLTSNATYTGNITGDGANGGTLVIDTTGSGKNIFTGNHSQNGGLEIQSGTVQVFDDNQLGAAGAPLIFGDSHLLLTSLNDFNLDHPISFKGTDSDAKLTVFASTTTVTIADTFTANHPDHSLEKLGGGNLAVTNPANTFFGTIIISNGQLIPTENSLQSARFEINTDDGLKISGSPVTVGSINGSGALKLETDLTIGNHGQTSEYSGALSQAGAKTLTKISGSTQIFSGTSTRNGPTILNDGILRVANTNQTPVGTGLLTVNSGATLDGHGLIDSPVTVNTGGVIEPSNATSILAMATLQLPGTFQCAMSASSAAQLDVSGPMNITNGTLALTGSPNQPATIIASYSNLTGTFATITGLPSGYTINYAYDGNHIAIVQDNTPPTVTITTTEGNPTNSNSITYNITFNEPVTGLVDFTDFYITGTTVASTDIAATTITNSGNNQTYTLTLNNISGDGFLQFRLRSNQIADIAGNNLASDPFAPGRIIDNTAPIITRNGAATITLVVGATWTDPEATATESATVITGGDTVITSTPGIYTITYDATDNAGNPATQVTRTVTVISAYDDWAATKGLTAGVNDAFTDDPDNDGDPNFKEFALDGNPLSAASDGKIRAAISSLSDQEYFTLTLPVFADTVFTGSPSPAGSNNGINYAILGSLNLGSWTETVTSVSPAESTGMPALGTGYEYRTFRLHQALAPSQKGFLHVEIIQN